MIRRSTWLAIFAFAVVLAAALLLTRTQDPDSQGLTPTPPPDPLWTVLAEDLQQVEIRDLEQDLAVILQRDEELGWVILEPESGPAQAGIVEQAVTSLLSPVPARVLEVDNLGPYGLEDPHYEVILLGEGGTTFRLSVGAESPTGTGYYAAVPDDRRAYVIRTFVLSDLLGFLEELPVALPTPEPTGVEDSSEGGDS